jgi:hypothetical protein
MSASTMRVEDRLDGASNWSPWKAMIFFVLEDLKLWDMVEAPVVVPPSTAPILSAEFRKRDNKEKRTMCDAVRDQIIPHLTGKDYAYEMWESLCKLYQSFNQNWKMVLFERIESIHMLKNESVTYYLGRFTQNRDELAAIEDIVYQEYMVRTS